jgi:hypothetical protein
MRPQVPERRNVVHSYPGFPDAMELIIGARLGFAGLVSSRRSAHLSAPVQKSPYSRLKIPHPQTRV